MAQVNSQGRSGPAPASPQLRRELGVFGAVMMGLGSIVGTGVFVSIGIAAGIAGPAVIVAIVLAAFVALCNGLSSAQLAAAGNPLGAVSGGTYEYGYKYLNSWLGFLAGWMFLCAKSASAATAALGFAGYLLTALGAPNEMERIALALAAVIVLTIIVLGGIRQSNAANIVMVSVTLAALIFFVVAGLPAFGLNAAASFADFFVPPSAGVSPVRTIFHAAALMFVAYTGYGRIATLGAEVRNPQRTIPQAIIATLFASMVLYVAVGAVAVGIAGYEEFARLTTATSAPLEAIADAYFGIPGAGLILVIGAITAMLGMLLNLLLGLSRVLLAMGRRKDMPIAFARVDKSGRTPEEAVVAVGVIIAALVLIGNVRTTWSFSAFTVLIYYAITNLAALQLPAARRRYPRAIAAVGLLACLFLAFWVEPQIWLTGLALIAVGFGWQWLMHRI